MIKGLIFILLSVALVDVAGAKLSTKQYNELSTICSKKARNNKNGVLICACVKQNLRWLLNDEDWSDAKKIYSGELTYDDYGEIDGRSEIDSMIYDIEFACVKDKSHNYLAPKTVSEMAKEILN